MSTQSTHRNLSKSFVRQYSQAYCGLACLASITQYYGGHTTQEKLQLESGTNLNGTSLLGLYQAALSMGFEAGGYAANIEKLKELNNPVILHTLTAEKMNHFVVCYGFRNGSFTIGDPAKGLLNLSEPELEAIWKTKALLQLTPGKKFIKVDADMAKKQKWILGLIQPDLPVLGVAAFLGILISVLSLATAIFTQKLIDELLPAKNPAPLVAGLALFGLVLLARAALSLVRSVLILRQGKDMNLRLISDFFGKLLFLPKPFFDSTTTGDMIARLNDAQRIQKVVVNLSSQVAIDLLIALTSIVYIFFLSPVAGYMVLGAIPLFGVVAWFFNHRIIVSQEAVMQNYAHTESKYIDTIQGINAVKSYNGEGWFSKVVSVVYHLYLQSSYQLGIISSKLIFWITMSSSAWMTLIISIGVYQVWLEQMLLGEMMAIVTIAGTLGTSLIGISMVPVQFHEARIAFNRMFEFAASQPEYIPNNVNNRSEKDPGMDFSLSMEGVSFRFPGKRLLLSKLTLSVQRGQTIALFGEVGCGKSTLLDILMRFQIAEEGMIKINNTDWSSALTPLWREKVAIVPQHVRLFNATLLENIAMEESPDPEKVVRFCHDFGFHPYIMELQQGYATIVNENSTNLSGGQRQLIALARALYKKPQLLLLDEATAAMDRKTEHFVIKLLKELKERLAIIMVTHRADLASMADTVYVIENKTISITGHPEFVKEHNTFFRSAFHAKMDFA